MLRFRVQRHGAAGTSRGHLHAGGGVDAPYGDAEGGRQPRVRLPPAAPVFAQALVGGKKSPSMVCSNRREMRNASGREGSYFPVSSATMVWCDTRRRSASTAWGHPGCWRSERTGWSGRTAQRTRHGPSPFRSPHCWRARFAIKHAAAPSAAWIRKAHWRRRSREDSPWCQGCLSHVEPCRAVRRVKETCRRPARGTGCPGSSATPPGRATPTRPGTTPRKRTLEHAGFMPIGSQGEQLLYEITLWPTAFAGESGRAPLTWTG